MDNPIGLTLFTIPTFDSSQSIGIHDSYNTDKLNVYRVHPKEFPLYASPEVAIDANPGSHHVFGCKVTENTCFCEVYSLVSPHSPRSGWCTRYAIPGTGQMAEPDTNGFCHVQYLPEKNAFITVDDSSLKGQAAKMDLMMGMYTALSRSCKSGTPHSSPRRSRSSS